ncbi:hypothetical protein VB734_08850 [Synechococcus sp. BA-124 BA4]|uniref:hypothetical protein n=1 Tax=unclassified Synechococcus TaxID=2626047 RepID=UPI002AD5097D|nr:MULTISPECIES: hypothetical protein [unclassified Synechococcus]MEA5400146.1 hypothetical protein [Synechococcus sp. BA-124 BA4]
MARLRSRGARRGRPSPWQISSGRGLARCFQLGIATTLNSRSGAGRVAARELARQGIAWLLGLRRWRSSRLRSAP